MKKVLLFIALFATCSAISNLTLANTPEYTIKSWQVGIIYRPAGTFGISPSTTDPDFSKPLVSMTLDGKVGIGTLDPTCKLDVQGTIRANEVLVNLNGKGGADFVFDTDYRLRPLSEVQSFITENKHLPEIQSAKDMQQNGVSVNELQFQLLQKIEELTLYIIEQDRQIKDLQQQVEQLQK